MPYFTLWVLDFFNTIRVSNSLDPDQTRQNVGPDLGPNCLYRSSAENKSRPNGQGVKYINNVLILPWLKFISFGSNLFHSAKVLATTNSEPE